MKNPVFFWKPKPKFKLFSQLNVGDAYSPELVKRVLATRGFTLKNFRYEDRRILAVGSILHYAQDGDVIWGSGLNGKVALEKHLYSKLDIRAVRGPRTAGFLRSKGFDVPEVFGDPGILADIFFPMKVTGGREFVVVPHFREDLDRFRNWPLLKTSRAPSKFLAELVKAKKVVSSSLHGIIFAEAYGIPAIYLRNKSGENDFKYADYYEGTGRWSFPVAESVEQALEMDCPPLPEKEVKEKLLNAFPWDCFSTK